IKMSDPCEEARAGLENATNVRIQVQWELSQENDLLDEYKSDMEGAASEQARAASAMRSAGEVKTNAAEKLRYKQQLLADDPNDTWKKADVREAKGELASAKRAYETARARATDAKTTHSHFKRKYENKKAYVKEKKNYWNRLTRSMNSWQSKVNRHCKS
ncbi:MAG: hypothetical protein AAFR27_05540, partial [Pseudomonadota bacterium]